jgi:dihydroorotase
VLIEGGRVVGIESKASPGLQEVDATGLLVLPGAVDAHVHSRDPGFPEKEDFGSLTAAAAAGGVTTVVDMPNTIPAVDSRTVFEEKAAAVSAQAMIDFGLWGAIRSATAPADLEGLAAAGAVGFKAYLGYAFRRANRQIVYTTDLDEADLEAPPDYGTLAELAPVLAARRALLAVHAEDPSVLRRSERPLRDYRDLLAARPPVAEAIAVAALGVISRETRVAVHIVHLSSAAGLSAAEEARRAGAHLTLETGPQYLWLTDADQRRLGPLMKMFPPIRRELDREALREALLVGEINIVATDHAPHTDQEKLDRSWADAAPGSPGVETLYLSCLELGRRWADLAAAVRWVSEGPARLLGLHPRKGVIEPNADADLVLVDPGRETAVSAARMHSRQRHSVLDGRRFGFAVRAVYSRGVLVASDGEPVGRPGHGQLVRRRYGS